MTEVLDLIEWNRSLRCSNWPKVRLERLVGQNPQALTIRTSEGPVEVLASTLYNQNQLILIPGIDKDRINELRQLGLVAIRAGKHFLYSGRRVIALFCGNLPAVDRLEALERGRPRVRA
jgi:hypothetical protein